MSEENLPKELTSNIARRGKWTVEEERYTEQIIEDFDQGVLDVPEGTTLRTYLSRVLNCDPMRITKKYTGNLCIGKRTFVPKPTVFESDFQYLGQCYSRLIDLRQCWINKLLLTEQWNNRKLIQVRGTKAPMDEPLPALVPSMGFNPVGLFTFSSLNPTPAGMMMMVPEPGASVSPPNEEATLTTTTATTAADTTSTESSADQLCFSEFKIFSTIRPFVKDIVETEMIIEWLKSCADVLAASSSSDSSESELLDQLASSCRLSMASLYKVLLSGCVTEFKLLHSCVQAVFERMILANEVPKPALSAAAPTAAAPSNTISLAASMMPVVLSSTDMQKLETVSNDDQHSVVSEQSSEELVQCAKRAKFELSSAVTPTAGSPTHASGASEAMPIVLPSSSHVNPVTPTNSSKATADTVVAVTLQDCVSRLKHKRSLQLMQGPISATAAQYKEQQHRALEYYRAAPEAMAVPTAPAAPFLIDPQSLNQKLTSSLNHSMVNISRSLLDYSRTGFNSFSGPANNNHMMYVTPSNIESAAEALLGLIAN